MMFLICPATNFLVDKNSVKYGLHTNIVPQEGYKGTNYQCLWNAATFLMLQIHSLPATNLLEDKNSVKYGLHTNIVPQEGY
jgi:hypothetical protein